MARVLFVLCLSLLVAAPAQAERYEISFFGADPVGVGLTGFIDLDPNPIGIYLGSSSFRSVVDAYEIRVAGDLRGDFIFTPANSLIGNGGRGWDLTWEVTANGIFVSSPSAFHGPSSEMISAFGGNEWLRLSTLQLDYRNNPNGGNQLTDYGPGPLPLAFNTFQPNGGPFIPSTAVPVPAALPLFLSAVGLICVNGSRRRRR